MGALCWVLPMEEDWETLEEEEEDGREVFTGVGLLERLLRLLDKVASCLGCWRPADGVVLLVNGLLVGVELKLGVEEMITSVFCALDFLSVRRLYTPLSQRYVYRRPQDYVVPAQTESRTIGTSHHLRECQHRTVIPASDVPGGSESNSCSFVKQFRYLRTDEDPPGGAGNLLLKHQVTSNI